MLLLIPKYFDRPTLSLVPGSVVVTQAQPAPGGHLLYYEGNVYGAENLRDFWDRVIHAGGRLAKRYPIVACAWVEDWRDSFDLAGRFNYERYRLEVEENQSQRQRFSRPLRFPSELQRARLPRKAPGPPPKGPA